MVDTAGLAVDPVPLVPSRAEIDIEAVIAARPDIQELEAAVRTAEARVAVARAERFDDPSVSLFFAYSSEGEGAFEVRERFLGARLLMPLPIPGWRPAPVEVARAEFEATRRELEAGRRLAREETHLSRVDADRERGGYHDQTKLFTYSAPRETTVKCSWSGLGAPF